MIVSNPELMFCPVVDCNGYAKKNKERDYNICNMGHKFCNKCGEKWHENGKCKEEENVDKLFEQYRRRYNLKNCPYCNIVVIKYGGCNHMNCKYCGKHWCWLCNEIFNSIDEHYGNINSKCYNRMMNDNNENNDIVICSKCEFEENETDSIAFLCGHIICNICFIQNLLENRVKIIFPAHIINCLIVGCNDIGIISGDRFFQIINNSNNENLIRKYRKSELLYEYVIKYIFALCSYFNTLLSFYQLVQNLFDKCCKGYKYYYILEKIGIILIFIFIPIYVLIIPYPLVSLKKLYYLKFLPEIKRQYNNKLITFSIILADAILSLVFIVSMYWLHYIFFCLALPIFCLVKFILCLYYRIPFC